MTTNRPQNERWIRIALFALPFILALSIMLPRLLSPQFGFEDDGMSLAMARKLLSGARIGADDNMGTFRPLYWLGIVFEVWLGGTNAFWFYAINLLVLSIVVAEILVLVRLGGGSVLQASLSATIFVLSSPIIESFYTNSKPEAQQLLWLTSSLLSGFFLLHARRTRRVMAFIVTTFFILLASLNKATFIALIPVSLGWLALSWLFLRQDKDEFRRTASYFISTLLATALFFLLRRLTLSTGITQGSYSNNYTLNINFMIFMMNHWAVWLTRGYLGLLACMVLALFLWRKLGTDSRKIALASLVWMFGWFVIYLPWDRAIDYYLLPFALGYAVFCGVIVGALPGLLPELKPAVRVFSVCMAGLLGLLLLMGIATNTSNAQVQLMMDRQNVRLLNFLSVNSPKGANIVANFNENATFFSHVPLLMSIVNNRSDINFIPFEFQTNLSRDEKPYLLVMPVITNQPLVKVRGTGEGQVPVNKSMEAFVNGVQPAFTTNEKAQMLTINPAILLCPLARQLPFYSIYCNKPASLLVDNRDYTFGWQVYEINTSKRNMSTPAVYTPTGELKIFNQGAPSSQYSLTTGDHPISADWNADGLTDIVFFNSKDLVWQVNLFPFSQRPLIFSLPGMTAADFPLAGDWNCDGSATPGYYRSSDTSWHLWGNPDKGEMVTLLTGARLNDVPIVGDWDGDDCDTVGVYRPDKGEVNLENKLIADLSGIDFNAPVNMIPIPADWGGLGMETLAFYNDGLWQISFANCECPPANGLKQLEFGAFGDIPLAGRWK